MGKFIKIVLVIYVIYYAVMIIFDLFIKKNRNGNAVEEGVQFDIEGFQTEDVEMTEDEMRVEQELEKRKNTFEDEDDEEPEPITQEGIEMEVEGQGFTVDEFSKMLSEAHHESGDFMNRLDALSIATTNKSI